MASSCWYIDGQPASDHQPCFPDQEISPCCILANNTDLCTTTGLCKTQKSDDFFQGPCTDPTYMSGNCSQYCPGPYDNWLGSDETVQFWNVFQCGNGVYCCRDPSDTSICCTDASRLKTKLAGPIIPQTVTLFPSSSSSGSVASTTTVSMTTAVSTAVPATASASADSKAWIAGAVLGPIALVVAIALALFILRRRRGQKKQRLLDDQTLHREKPELQDNEISRKELADANVEELGNESHTRGELEAKIAMLESKIVSLEGKLAAHELGPTYKPTELEGSNIARLADHPAAIQSSGARFF